MEPGTDDNQADDETEFPGARTVSRIVHSIKSPFQHFWNSDGKPPVWDVSDEYDTSHPCRGTMIIFNNEHFKIHSSRPGSSVDARNLYKTFTMLGFLVQCHHNQTKDQMINILKRVSKSDHSNSDCFVCAILSHGDEVHVVDDNDPDRHEREDVVYATDDIVLTRQLVSLFTDTKCKTLAGKPKLFFMQACRGSTLDSGVSLNVMVDEVDSSQHGVVEVTPCPLYKDFLMMYATPPGHYAFRRPDTGSWFVRALCQVFSQPSAEKHSLNQLLTSVIKLVSQEYQSRSTNRKISGRKQTPCFMSMLVKDVYFRPKNNSTPV